MAAEQIAVNLRRLCGYYPSVAEVCRRIGINRQQFNKYLNGSSTPSIGSLKKICDFFGVEEGELLLASDDFAALIEVRQRAAPSPLADSLEKIAAQHGDSQQKLQRYCGYYHTYMHSPAFPGTILRYLCYIYQLGDHTYGKSVERLVDKRHPEQGGFVSKYASLILHTDDRIYVMDHNPHSHQVFALTVLYPSHRSRLHLLTGLGIAVSGGPGRQAFATRVVYEYLGETCDRRAAIAACGLYPDDGPEIEDTIKLRLKNEIRPGESTLCSIDF